MAKRISVKKVTAVCLDGPFAGTKLAVSPDGKTAWFRVGPWHGRYCGGSSGYWWENRHVKN